MRFAQRGLATCGESEPAPIISRPPDGTQPGELYPLPRGAIDPPNPSRYHCPILAAGPLAKW